MWYINVCCVWAWEGVNMHKAGKYEYELSRSRAEFPGEGRGYLGNGTPAAACPISVMMYCTSDRSCTAAAKKYRKLTRCTLFSS